jgi:hypothetical protein
MQNGAVLDLFDEEFRKVLTNIEDENTNPKTVRTITLKVSIKPDETRRTGAVSVQVSSTLSKVNPTVSLLFFDREKDGSFVALEDVQEQELPGISEKAPVQFPRANEV